MTKTTLMVMLVIALLTCHFPQGDKLGEAFLVDTIPQVHNADFYFPRSGKDEDAAILPALYTLKALDSLDLPIIEGELVEALEYQRKLLNIKRQKAVQQLGNLAFSIEELKRVVDQLLNWQYTKPLGLSKLLEAHQLWGEDRRGNVLFTGYYAPLIKVSKTKTGLYQYPIYSRPKNWEGPYPTREEIDGEGALEGRGLELAYAKNRLDIYFMQVQGSGYAEYTDGERVLFAYDGSNRRPYRSIGRYMSLREDIGIKDISIPGIKRFFQKNPDLLDTVLFVNSSYTFFTTQKSRPRGAGLVPLTADYSIAVDRKYIPLGACLLAKVPVFSVDGQLQGHEYRFLLAQDIGGAIKGAGHVDLFSGSGDVGRIKAGMMHHYGKLWLLLPRRPETFSPDQDIVKY